MVLPFTLPLLKTRRLFVLTLLFLPLFLPGCVTLPQYSPENPPPDILGWLPPESHTVLRLRVPGNEALISGLASSLGFDLEPQKEIIKRISLLGVGIEAPKEGEKPSLHLAALGRWPQSLAGAFLGKDWVRKGKFYQRQSDPRTFLMIPSSLDMLLSAGRIEEMAERRQEQRPFDFVREEETAYDQAALSLWLKEPPSFPLPRGFSLPWEGLSLFLWEREEDLFDADCLLYLNDPAAVGAFSTGLRIFIATQAILAPRSPLGELLTKLSIESLEGAVLLRVSGMDSHTLYSVFKDIVAFGLQGSGILP